MFKRKQKLPAADTRMANPFAAVPLKPEAVDAKLDSQGMMHLRLNARPTGVAGKIAKWVRYDYTRKLQLDEYGTFYYSQIDGVQNLDSIIVKMCARFRKDRPEIQQSVMLFTKKLMTLNMVNLEATASVKASE